MKAEYKEKLDLIQDSVYNIKNAIIDKGVQITDTEDITTFAEKISKIQGGGEILIEDIPYKFDGLSYIDTNILTPDHIYYTYEVKFKASQSSKHIFGLRLNNTLDHISIVQGEVTASSGVIASKRCIICRYAKNTLLPAYSNTYMIFGLNGEDFSIGDFSGYSFIENCYEAGDLITVLLNKDKAVLINHTKGTQYELLNQGDINFTLPESSFYLGAVNTINTSVQTTNIFNDEIYHLAFIKNNLIGPYFSFDKDGLFTEYDYFDSLTRNELKDGINIIDSEIASKDSEIASKDSEITSKDIEIASKDIEIEALKELLNKEEYDPVLDEYTHIFFTPQSNSTVYSFQINPTGETFIDWGDETDPDVLTTTGIQFVTHTYSSFPNATTANNGVGAILYTQVEIIIYSESPYSIEGKGTSSGTSLTATNYRGMNNMAQYITEIIPATNCTFGNFALCACYEITNIKFSPLQTVIPQYCFYNCNLLNYPKFDNITSIGTYAFAGIYNTPKTLIIPQHITSIGERTFAGSTAGATNSIIKVIWNSPQMFIQNYTFGYCYNLEILDLRSATKIMRFGASETSTTTGTSNYITAAKSKKLKIIVPKDLYNSWKTTTYWRYFWQFLYWVDDEGNYRNDTV